MAVMNTSSYLSDMENVMKKINSVTIKDSCENKADAQKKLDEWKSIIADELENIRQDVINYVNQIIANDEAGPESPDFPEMDKYRTLLHNKLIGDICIAVRLIKFNFAIKDYSALIKAMKLPVDSYMSSAEIEKPRFEKESLFIPETLFNSNGLLDVNFIKQKPTRSVITVWAQRVYADMKARGIK